MTLDQYLLKARIANGMGSDSSGMTVAQLRTWVRWIMRAKRGTLGRFTADTHRKFFIVPPEKCAAIEAYHRWIFRQ